MYLRKIFKFEGILYLILSILTIACPITYYAYNYIKTDAFSLVIDDTMKTIALIVLFGISFIILLVMAIFNLIKSRYDNSEDVKFRV